MNRFSTLIKKYSYNSYVMLFKRRNTENSQFQSSMGE